MSIDPTCIHYDNVISNHSFDKCARGKTDDFITSKHNIFFPVK